MQRRRHRVEVRIVKREYLPVQVSALLCRLRITNGHEPRALHKVRRLLGGSAQLVEASLRVRLRQVRAHDGLDAALAQHAFVDDLPGVVLVDEPRLQLAPRILPPLAFLHRLQQSALDIRQHVVGLYARHPKRPGPEPSERLLRRQRRNGGNVRRGELGTHCRQHPRRILPPEHIPALHHVEDRRVELPLVRQLEAEHALSVLLLRQRSRLNRPHELVKASLHLLRDRHASRVLAFLQFSPRLLVSKPPQPTRLRRKLFVFIALLCAFASLRLCVRVFALVFALLSALLQVLPLLLLYHLIIAHLRKADRAEVVIELFRRRPEAEVSLALSILRRVLDGLIHRERADVRSRQ